MRNSKIIAALAIAATMSIGGAFALTGCGDNHEHSFTKWNSNASQHWKECPDDGEKDENSYGSHAFTDDSDTTCNDCGYVRVVETPDPDKDKDDDDDDSDNQAYIISGTVTAYEKALSGVVVTIGGKEYVTDARGNYTSEEIEIEDSISVTFTKSGYVTKTLTVSKADLSGNKATLNAEMNLTNETGTISGTIAVPISGYNIPLDNVTIKLGDTTIVTEAGGEYSFSNIPMGQELTLTVTHPACEVYSETITLPGGQTALSKDIVLIPAVIGGLNQTLFDLAMLDTLTDSVFNTDAIKDKWSSYGDVDKHDQGACIQLNDNHPVSYVYAKIAVTEQSRYMKFNARMFVRPNDRATGLLVQVIEEDGTLAEVAPAAIYRSGQKLEDNIRGNMLVNDNDDYTEGVYDLDEYVGQTIVIVIQAIKLDDTDYQGQDIHNAINEIAFKADSFYFEGNITGTVTFGGEAVEGATVSCGGEKVSTGADGKFTLPVAVLPDNEVKITISKEGYKDAEYTVSANDIATGEKDLGDINLINVIIPGLAADDIEKLNTLTDSVFNTDGIKDKWGQYGDVNKHGEGTCIQLGDNAPVSYLYAKIAVTQQNRYMKFNARMFVRTDDRATGVLVSIIKADGTLAEVAPSSIYRSGSVITDGLTADGRMLVNNNDAYTEGVYDLSDYVGETVVIVIQAIKLDGIDYEGKAVHNAINEIAFRDNPFYAAGTVNGTVTDSDGSPIEGAIVNVNGRTVTTQQDGKFEMEVVINYSNKITVAVSASGYAKEEVEVTGAQIVEANGELQLADIALTEKSLAETIGEVANLLQVIDLDQRHQFGSTASGGVDGWTDSGYELSGHDICIPYGEYVFAKLKITDNYKFMKFNARGKDGIGGKMLVMVYVDGQLTELAPSRVYGTNQVSIEGNYLINNRGDSYNEGVYDFSDYVGQEIIVVIQTAACLEDNTEAYTKCNEIAFFGSINCDKGDNPDPNNYYEASSNN